MFNMAHKLAINRFNWNSFTVLVILTTLKSKIVTQANRFPCNMFSNWTRKHSTRVRTARLLTGGGVIPRGGMLSRGGVLLRGCAVQRGCAVKGGAVHDRTGHNTSPPPCEQNESQTLVKIIPFPKFRLRVVINMLSMYGHKIPNYLNHTSWYGTLTFYGEYSPNVSAF